MPRPQKRPPFACEFHKAVEVAAPPEALLPSKLRFADGASAAIGSPARALQAGLAASFVESAQSDRMPPGLLIFPLVVASLLGWTVVALAARAFFF